MSGPAPNHLPLRELLQRHNLQLKKSLGQNFLHDAGALERIVRAADVGPDDTVLEIGPGAGSLTQHLAYNARHVIAVEIDDRLRPLLTETLDAYPNVTLVFGDILDQPISTLIGDGSYKVVANVPYYITSAILRHLLESQRPPTCLVLTVQREVAERIVAAPGDLSLLAVSVQYYGQPRLLHKIGAGAFFPRPEVDSAVLRVDVHAQPLAPDVPPRTFFRVVQAGFSQKRKQLKNALVSGLGRPAAHIDTALATAGIDGRRRAETLTIDEWLGLARAVG